MNLVADVALVVGLGWGIGGAALATVASQAVVATALVYLLLKTGREKRAAAETAGNGSSRVDDVKASYYEGGVILEDADVIDEDAVELPSLEAVPRSIPGLAKAKRFTKIAGPVLFLNSIKVLFVASLVQAVTAISPACSAANGASFFLFPYGQFVLLTSSFVGHRRDDGNLLLLRRHGRRRLAGGADLLTPGAWLEEGDGDRRDVAVGGVWVGHSQRRRQLRRRAGAAGIVY